MQHVTFDTELNNIDWNALAQGDDYRLVVGDYYVTPNPKDQMAVLITRLRYLEEDHANHARGMYRVTDAEFWAPYEPIGQLADKLLFQSGRLHLDNVERLRTAGFVFRVEPNNQRYVIGAGTAWLARPLKSWTYKA